MAQYNLGKVSIRPRGAYSATANYTPLDMVTNLGGAWLCITSASGVEPGVYSTWANYWLNITKGVQSVSVTSPATGKATISITLSDGTTNSITIDTAAIGEGAVGTNELADQSVTLNKLAPNARTNVKTISLPAASWSGSGPYTQPVTVAGSTAQSQINIQGNQTAIAAANSGGFAVQISNTGGTLTAYAIGTKPTTDLTLQVTIVELSGATGTIVGAPLSGSGVADGAITIPKLATTTKDYIAAVNLLDNSDFTQFIAQAGISGKHGNDTYAGDRWILVSGTVTGTANENGNGYSDITLNGTIVEVVANPPATGTPVIEMISGTASINYDATAGEVTITSSGGVLKNATLYEGEYAAGSEPKYQPKGYGAELVECQRYYRYYTDIVGAIFYPDNTATGVKVDTMRIKPTVSCDPIEVVGIQFSTPTAYTVKGDVRIVAPTGSGAIGGGVYIKNLAISADLPRRN